ncbi:hypothetical protein V6N11_081237 [Hibiscus sabdariffa]|uniref:RNase H type-1 domain-containing protein n=1 Tax=Hibiscus sabdariffa TaxID=183260 RepID=A0ABR2QJA7_9ROSI
MWFITIAAAIWWSLWLTRNDKVFREKSLSSLELLFQAKMRALIWIKAENKDLVLIDGDWWTHPKLPLASSANVVTEWTPPDEGAVKFNVDGSVLLNRAGCGGVLRNHKGEVIAIFSGLAECFGADYSELVAVKMALNLFKETNVFGKTRLVIESDSQIVLNWLQNFSARPWKWWCLFEVIDRSLKQIPGTVTVFVPRARNSFVDYLAKSGAKRNELFKAHW